MPKPPPSTPTKKVVYVTEKKKADGDRSNDDELGAALRETNKGRAIEESPGGTTAITNTPRKRRLSLKSEIKVDRTSPSEGVDNSTLKFFTLYDSDPSDPPAKRQLHSPSETIELKTSVELRPQDLKDVPPKRVPDQNTIMGASAESQRLVYVEKHPDDQRASSEKLQMQWCHIIAHTLGAKAMLTQTKTNLVAASFFMNRTHKGYETAVKKQVLSEEFVALNIEASVTVDAKTHIAVNPFTYKVTLTSPTGEKASYTLQLDPFSDKKEPTVIANRLHEIISLAIRKRAEGKENAPPEP